MIANTTEYVPYAARLRPNSFAGGGQLKRGRLVNIMKIRVSKSYPTRYNNTPERCRILAHRIWCRNHRIYEWNTYRVAEVEAMRQAQLDAWQKALWAEVERYAKEGRVSFTDGGMVVRLPGTIKPITINGEFSK